MIEPNDQARSLQELYAAESIESALPLSSLDVRHSTDHVIRYIHSKADPASGCDVSSAVFHATGIHHMLV